MRILGPLKNVLERNVGQYEKYADAMQQADVEMSAAAAVPDEPGAQEKKQKTVHRKRERKAENLGHLEAHAKPTEMSSSDAPQSLAEKVAQDFSVPALVEPCEAFVVPGANFCAFGGVTAGQKFTMDKALVARAASAPLTKTSEDEVYEWTSVSKMKHETSIAVMCQKGQKSASDPTPNQDNYFVQHVGDAALYGVADGHGPFGHLVSFRVVQALPHFLTRSPNFGKDWALALKEAFLATQKDLEDFCAAMGVNIEASGAAASVLVLHEQTAHVAFVGDARIMLGSWNRRDSRMVFCSKDHKPDLPEERARLEAAGSEVREIDPGNHRIYRPGSDFPGLTMSRAFGDTACAGVLREPEYHKFLMQPTDEWYAIVASDGIWEFIEGEEACSMTSKKLRLKGPRETLNFLVQASRKRWQHCCGDYCDDITGVLIQWNAKGALQAGSCNNNLFTVRRSE